MDIAWTINCHCRVTCSLQGTDGPVDRRGQYSSLSRMAEEKSRVDHLLDIRTTTLPGLCRLSLLSASSAVRGNSG